MGTKAKLVVIMLLAAAVGVGYGAGSAVPVGATLKATCMSDGTMAFEMLPKP